jgi:hypothetical protein
MKYYYLMLNCKYRFFCFLCLLVLCLSSNAQTPTSSPYSRFGLGDFAPNKIFAQSSAMGGSNIALKNDTLLPLFLNPANPASYSSVRLATFEVGLNTMFNKFSNTNTFSKGNNTTFNYIALGFPVKQSMGACIGVMPASSVGYKIQQTSTVTNIGDVTELYEGDGGINSLFIGLAGTPFLKPYKKFMGSQKIRSIREDIKTEVDTFRTLYSQYVESKSEADGILLAQQRKEIYNKNKALTKKIFIKRWLSSLSLGANGYYYFGTITNNNRVLYPAQSNFFNTSQIFQTQINAFTGSFGVQNTFIIDSVRSHIDTIKSSPTYGYMKRRDLKQNVEISWGYTYSLNNDLKAYYSNFAYTFLYKGNGINEFLRDTTVYEQDVRTNINLPVMHGIGVSIRKGSKLNILADYQMQLWSGFKYINEHANFVDMKRVSIGVEYIPNKLANLKGNYLKKVQYRAGAKYSDGRLLINNSRVNEYGVSLGLGLPVGMNRAFNTFNIALEMGQIGNKSLVEHKYIQVKLGFTFNDRWFLKYKYD